MARFFHLDNAHLPRTPEITVEALRRLLADLPGDVRLAADDATMFVLLGADDTPLGVIDIAQARLSHLQATLLEPDDH